jgi:hypothetical protein
VTQEEVVSYIRIILGGISVQTLPDEVIILFYNRWSLYFDLQNNPEKLPLVLWNTCVSCLEWLLASSSANGGYSTERTEKIGQEQITVKGGSQLQAWKDLLKYITENPEYIDPSLSSRGLSIIVGGVRQSIVDEIRKNPDSRGWNKVDSVVKYNEESSYRDTNYIYHLGAEYD